MVLVASTPLNKTLDVDTFGDLATIVASRLGSVSSAQLTGEQKFNSIQDSITVDAIVGHFKATFAGSLPSTNIPAATDKLNGTTDIVTLAHVVKYLKDVAGIDISVPVNSVAPVITGDGVGPFTVSANGTWTNDPDSYTYQWQGDASDLVGETAVTLAVDEAYDDVSITCLVTAHNEAGASAAEASNAIVGEGIPVNSVAPTIAGTGTGPFNVSATGTWSNNPDSFTYQWQGNAVDIVGEVTDTLADDVAYDGVSITCLVAGVNEAGAGVEVASNAIVGAV